MTVRGELNKTASDPLMSDKIRGIRDTLCYMESRHPRGGRMKIETLKKDPRRMTPGYTLGRTADRELWVRRTAANASRAWTKVSTIATRMQKPVRTVRIARDAIDIVERAIATGIFELSSKEVTGCRLLLRDYVSNHFEVTFEWLNCVAGMPIRRKTYEKYTASYRLHAYNLIPSELTMSAASQKDVWSLVKALRAEKCTEAVILNCLVAIRKVMEYARLEEEIIETNPAAGIRIKQKGKVHRDLLTKPELRTLLELLEARAHSSASGSYAERVWMATRLMIHTAMREGECRALKMSKIRRLISPGGKPTRIYEIIVDESWDDAVKECKPTKGEYSRIVYVWEDLGELLQNLATKNPYDNGYVFWHDSNPSEPIYKDRLTDYVYSALTAIGISEEERRNRRINLHGLRHFYVSASAAAVDREMISKIKESEGHRSEAIRKRYQHPTYDAARRLAHISRDLLLEDDDTEDILI